MQSIIAFIMAVIAAIGLYPRTGYVVDIDDAVLTIEDGAGLIWVAETAADDWDIGDGVSMIMYDNGTPESIYDDAVVAARYNGFWR